MTTDYEKKYKDALAKAKAYFENENYTEMADVFPELAESEDERIREWLIRTVRLIGVDKDICADQETMDKAIAWLEKQKEQKTSWSEEDEKMLKNVLFVLESFVSNTESKSSPSLIASYHTYYKEIDWLKSLRPSWKPSKEQMEALEIILRYGDKESTHIKNLTSLYNQLKKL